MIEKEITLLGCGDVGPMHGDMEPYSTLVRPVLATGDIRFAQCERLYSLRGSRQVSAPDGGRGTPDMARIFTDCGFNVVSLASNLALDWGEDALLDTIDLLRDKGIQVIGAGRNLNEARKPAVIEKDGVRVAILAYCSVPKEGYSAGPNKIGVAPMRAHTSYEQVEYQAGMPPRIVTVPDSEDLARMVEDIADAKKTAHAVIVSLHWGIHFIPRIIADYQPLVAKAAYAAGADLILGHHAHVPKAIATYGGKVCFYSLSNFIFSSAVSGLTPERIELFAQRYGVTLDPEFPNFPLGNDARRSLIAKAVISRAGISKVSFLPALIDKQIRPEVLLRNDPRFDDAVNFMKWVSEGFDPTFMIEGNEVIVSG